MLRMESWEPVVPDPHRGVVTAPSRYVRHAGHTAASLARIIKEHSVDQRCVDHVTAWAHESTAFGSDQSLVTEDAYAVLGWTSAAVLRSTLSQRLHALNPVAAFRLLEQPEIERLEQARLDYVVLRSRYGFGNEWPAELSGAISALDIDLWFAPGPAELDGAVALDLDSYLRHFAGTEIAD
nr:hypothetical protein [Propionicimonas sp.]